MGVVEDVEKLVAPLLEAQGIELVDLQWVTESGKKVLRVFIDKPSGIKLADCGNMSALISAELDEKNTLPGQYLLEVSSPGIDRVLKKEKDFARFVGKRARIVGQEPINGQRNFCGELKSAAGGLVTIDDVTNGAVTIAFGNIVRARLDPEI
ncbi:MAG: ribosome maturation factor RimP [Elusimicrobia bacterium]|nr:ribosome maturation factor RimP [Elusimicrobiota bacterium]